MAVNSERTKLVLRLLTAFVVGVVTLTLEIAYTRVISFKLFYYYTYFVIGLALLGLGSAAAVTALSARLRDTDSVRLIRRVAPAAAAVGLVGYVVVARMPTDVNLIWTGSTGEAVEQVARLLFLSLSLTAVFFAVGVLLASLFVVEVEHVRRLYFFDLSGAALGCVLAVPLQATIGPPAMIFTSLVLLALLAFAAALVERTAVTMTAVIVVMVTAGAFLLDDVKVRTDASKTVRDNSDIAAGDWGAVFRVDVTPGFGDNYILHHDGLWGAGIWRYDGTPATTARFRTDNRQIPFAATRADAPSVLIVGAAGGHEIQAALTYGAGHIDAVELNPVTVDLLRHDFADYAGNITEHPNVNYVQGDGRTFLARSDDAYDIIWFVAPDSYAASNAATAGAFVLSESYLYTKEMIDSAYEHLSDDGVIVAQFGDLDFESRPMRTARYLVTARAALDDDVDRFADQAALAYEAGGDAQFLTISTIMLFRTPVDSATAERIETSTGMVPNAEVLYLPGGTRVDGLTSDVIDLPDEELDQVVDDYPLDISAIDDNRPFFWHFTSFSTVLGNWEREFEDAEIAIGERLLLVLLTLTIVIAAVLLWLPFAVTTRGASRTRFPRRGRLFVYFASLGLGFMLIEISMIQRFALLLGYPTLSLSVSLFTLLIATAIGARISTVVRRLPWAGLPAVVAALIAIVSVYMATSGSVTDAALSWPQGARIVLVFALLFPIGLMLGVFLPTGMDAVIQLAPDGEHDRGRVVAWCWAVNGFFSVMGATLTTIVSMTFGFDVAILCGLAIYLVATAALAPSRAAPEIELPEHPVPADAPA